MIDFWKRNRSLTSSFRQFLSVMFQLIKQPSSMGLAISYPAAQPMKSFSKYFLAIVSTLAINVPIAFADTVTVIEGSNSSTSEMVRPGNYTYGNDISQYDPRYKNPNIVPYRLSPTPQESPYFTYPQTNTRPYSTTEPRQPQQTMGLTYTSQGGLDHFSMYMDWGNIATQQNQPQVALNWYQKALAMRPTDKNVIRAIQSLQTSTRK